jgi:hypothetical protein
MVSFILQLFYPNTHLTGGSVDPKGSLAMMDNRKISYLCSKSKSGQAANSQSLLWVSSATS